jgi:hypothetical protein
MKHPTHRQLLYATRVPTHTKQLRCVLLWSGVFTQVLQRLQDAVALAAGRGTKTSSSQPDAASVASGHDATASEEDAPSDAPSCNKGSANSDNWPHFICPFLQRLVSYLAAREQGRAAAAAHLRDSKLSPAVAFLVADVADDLEWRGSECGWPALQQQLLLHTMPSVKLWRDRTVVQCYEVRYQAGGSSGRPVLRTDEWSVLNLGAAAVPVQLASPVMRLGALLAHLCADQFQPGKQHPAAEAQLMSGLQSNDEQLLVHSAHCWLVYQWPVNEQASSISQLVAACSAIIIRY